MFALLTNLQERAAVESAYARICMHQGKNKLAVFMQKRAAYTYACARAVMISITLESSNDRPLTD